MKKVLFFCVLLFSFQLISQELLLHYSFDGNSNDISGNNYNGNSSGVKYVNDRNGNANSAVSFDGIDDFIDLPNISILKPDLPVSFSFWIKYESDDVEDRVVFNTSYKEDVNSGIYLSTQSSTGKLAVGYGDGSASFTSSNRRSYLSNNVIQSNAWHQIHIVILSSTNMKVYLDCIETGGSYSGTGSALKYSTNPGSLGRHDQNSSAVASYYFKGVLDDFKYYKGEIVPTITTTNFTSLPVEICRNSVYTLPTTSTNGITGSWSPAFDNSTIGTSSYTFKPDTGQCASSFNHTIEITNEVTPSFTNLESSLCLGTSYNLPIVSSNGITGNWSPGFDSSKVGTTSYTFTPDSDQCAISFNHSIEVTNKIIPSFTNLETSLCKGTTFSLPLVSSNGITGEWSPVFDNSKVGTTSYTFTPDSDQCASSFNHSIEIINKVTPSFTNLESLLCEGTSYSLPTSSSNGIIGSWSPVFDNSLVGTTSYTFTPDSDQCASSINHLIEITNEIVPSFTNLETSLCKGALYSLPTTSSNGIIGSWLPIFDSSTLGTTSYTFTPDSGQCAANVDYSIEITNDIVTNFTNLETSLCLGTSYSLPTTSLNGVSGSWLPVFDSSKLGTTIYTFTPSGVCGTIIIHTIEITDEIVPSFTNLETSVCLGTSYSLPTSSSNGITGNWLPIFDSSKVGTTSYTFTPNSGQCASSFNHSIEIINKVTPSFTNLESLLCEGTTYSLPTTSSNGIIGSWLPIFDNLKIGTTSYTFTPNSDQCASSFNHSIDITNEIIPSFTNLETYLCKGSLYSLPTTSSNGIIGSWSPVFDNSLVGTTSYTFTPDSDQCASSFNHSIEITNEIVPSFTNLETSLCKGSLYSLPITSSNGIIGSWLPIFDSSTLGTTAYTFTPDSGQCAVNVDYTIEITNDIVPVFTNIETTLCINTSYSLPLSSSNGITGSWLPVFDSSKLGTTIYTFTPSGACGTILNHTIEITDEIVPSFTNLETSVCLGTSYSLPITSSNGIIGNWLPIFDNSTVGTTSYTFTPDTGQCASSFNHSIEITNEVTPSFPDLESLLCEGTTYSLPTTSSNGIIGSWLPIFDNSKNGITTYTFTPDSDQCAIEINHTIDITQKEEPIFSNLPKLIFKGESYNLPNISDNGILGNWNPLFDSSTIGEVTYTFTPVNIDCKNSFTYIISVIEELVIPLFFTPNNDEINDFWKILGLNNYTNVELSIFNRYGKLLSKPDIFIGWDGRYQGKDMPSNDYWYLLSAVNINNEIIIRKGHFSLLRK